MPFLSARPHAHPAAVIIGAPYDATATHRAGARAAPAAIRWASDSLETYSPVQRRDLEDLALADENDLDLDGCAPETMITRVRDAVARVEGLPIVLGGEHTVTVGAVGALAGRHPDLAVVLLDAHLDLRDEYDGQRLSHATTIRRIADQVGPERIAVLGARSGTREEWAQAASLAAATAPGTGTPDPRGLGVDDFVALLAVLREGRVVGCDLVEVSPPYDPSGQTAMLAAWLVREMILAFAR